jgi:hypothetical protein
MESGPGPPQATSPASSVAGRVPTLKSQSWAVVGAAVATAIVASSATELSAAKLRLMRDPYKV